MNKDERREMKNELVVSLMHSNYMINSYGTEKYVRALGHELNENGYNHLCFFSVFHDFGSKSVGVIYNDTFRGILKYSEIISIVSKICEEENLSLNIIHVHNMLNHQLLVIEELALHFNVGIVFFVHDFFLVCNRYKLIDTSGGFCGISQPSNDKCGGCSNCLNGINHYHTMKDFLLKNLNQINSVVCPSKYVAAGIESVYPYLKSKIIIRPHLTFVGKTERPQIRQRIHVGYAGLQVKDKGFEEWKNLVNMVSQNTSRYEFFYFGTGREHVNNVTNVYVSIAEQGDSAMLNALRKFEIDVGFIWTMCPETYSYVYYEFAASGAFVITNQKSGNVCEEVKTNRNGVVFSSFNKCVDYLLKVDTISSDINKFRRDINGFSPLSISNNISMRNLLGTSKVKSLDGRRVKYPSICKLKTIVYYIKHFKMLHINGEQKKYEEKQNRH